MCSSCDCKCKTEDKKLPADWAIERAIDRYRKEINGSIFSAPTLDKVKNGYWPSLIALSRCMEENEEPPAAAELKAARQYAAERAQFPSSKTRILSGEVDHSNMRIIAFLAGVEWARVNNG